MEMNELIELLEMLHVVNNKPQKDEDDFKVGEKYCIQTHTNYFIGELVKSTKDHFHLIKCAWVICNNRLNDAMRTGEFDEVNPYLPEAIVMVRKDSCIASLIWPHPLPQIYKNEKVFED